MAFYECIGQPSLIHILCEIFPRALQRDIYSRFRVQKQRIPAFHVVRSQHKHLIDRASREERFWAFVEREYFLDPQVPLWFVFDGFSLQRSLTVHPWFVSGATFSQISALRECTYSRPTLDPSSQLVAEYQTLS